VPKLARKNRRSVVGFVLFLHVTWLDLTRAFLAAGLAPLSTVFLHSFLSAFFYVINVQNIRSRR